MAIHFAPLDWALALWVIAFLIACPFTKVEESFNLQASHDILMYGRQLAQYDHFAFPGVVPRTFLGPLALSGLAFPWIHLLAWLDVLHSKLALQYIIRAALGLTVVLSNAQFRAQVAQSFGRPVATAYGVVSLCQFHVVFWSSRMLGNVLAYPLVLCAWAQWLKTTRLPLGDTYTLQILRMISILAITTCIFRFDVVAFAIPILGSELWRQPKLLWSLVVPVAITATVAVMITLAVDSYFWQTPWMWPEAYVFWFNVIRNQSAQWGTLPWHAYWTSFLPRLLLGALPLIPLGIYANPGLRRYVVPALVGIALFSGLGHKEWRFILPALPWLNLSAAAGLITLAHRRIKLNFQRLYRWGYRGACAGLFLSWLLSLGMLYVSRHNYPGGHALAQLHTLTPAQPRTYVHLDTLTAMTGASRFGQLHAHWTYDKNETATPATIAQRADYVITARPKDYPASFGQTVAAVSGYRGVRRVAIADWVSAWRQLTVAQAVSAPLEVLASLVPVRLDVVPQLWIIRSHAAPSLADPDHPRS
ncbi:alpha-1,6- mannosyltransferase [Dimargaris verticillata]|uniref:Mannosyltransferase n=1 Tax=Dimargaris verticillata TaxID=2761393 RepID=A0A9W8B2H2_9FUNG|nr:alpha-1,6- mannosyltransferase [Dimargaris verticillata]